MDLLSTNVIDYSSAHGVDTNLHPYMHNIMTLKTLEIDTYWATKKDLQQYFTNDAYITVKSIKDPKNFNNEYIVQY